MNKASFILSILLLSAHSHTDDFEHAVGFGLQYGGVVGYQLSTTVEQGVLEGPWVWLA